MCEEATGAGREREEADGMQNQKQEPHTKMWGKIIYIYIYSISLISQKTN